MVSDARVCPDTKIALTSCDGVKGCKAQLVAALALVGLAPPTAIAADVVSVVHHGDGRYTLSTTLAGTTNPAHGQIAIVPTAEELCGDRYPHYGRYRFDASAPSKATEASGPTSLTYRQDIECSDVPQQAAKTASAPVPPAPSTAPTDEDGALIRARTVTYLQAKDAADAGAAYKMLSKEMASYTSPEVWKDTRTSFTAKVGPGAQPTVVRITWYDDPQGAPTPGRYVAADYRVDYPSEAFTCGYVVWLRQADGGYLIVREEEGQATPDLLANLSPEQRLQMRAQLQCRD